MTSADVAGLDRLAAQQGVFAEGAYQLPTQSSTAASTVSPPMNEGQRIMKQQADAAAAAQKDPNASWWSKQTPMEKAGYSTLGAGLVAGLNAPPNTIDTPDDDYSSSLRRLSPNFRAQEPIQPNPYYRARYPTYAAEGGLLALAKGGMADLGGYSDGGRMLKGPGDGMSDSIPGVIANKQPARLADGEFVVPADVVSHLGNGSTDAGAKRLYAMMDKVRKARTGKKKQAPAVNTARFLPA
jgi:hypothetical protein